MMFKLSALSSLALALCASAQNINVAAPSAGTTLTAGQNFTVELDKPATLTPSSEVAVVIGLTNPTSSGVGRVLYSGSFTPERQAALPQAPPHQNFTLTIPSNMPSGPAIIQVAHFSLVGAGPSPTLEMKNVSVTIA